MTAVIVILVIVTVARVTVVIVTVVKIKKNWSNGKNYCFCKFFLFFSEMLLCRELGVFFCVLLDKFSGQPFAILAMFSSDLKMDPIQILATCCMKTTHLNLGGAISGHIKIKISRLLKQILNRLILQP